jgi:hypothetical protein
VGERRAFLCGRWVLEVGIDWGMFSDMLAGGLLLFGGEWYFVGGLSQTMLMYVHMPKNVEEYGGLYILPLKPKSTDVRSQRR